MAPQPTVGGAMAGLSPAASGTFFEFQVEQPVHYASGSATPRYPSILKQAGVEGEVLASFVVDTMGRADVGSYKVLKTTHELFSNAVRDALPNMTFVPAMIRGRKVRQLVQTPFVFGIARTAPTVRPGAVYVITVPGPTTPPAKSPQP